MLTLESNQKLVHAKSRCYCGASGHDAENQIITPVTDHHAVSWNVCRRCWRLMLRDERSNAKQVRKAERAANEYVLGLAGAGIGM